jgi:tetratricopeptide (TPR) repeat protein
MTTKKTVFKAIVALVVAGLFACGPKPPPKTGPGGGTGDNTGLPPPVKPKRVVSKEAKGDFRDAVKAYKSAGRINKANCASLAAKFAEVFQDHPKLAEAKFNEGVVWEECGDIGKAERAYQELVRRHPNHGAALNNLGQIFFARGNHGQAMDYFRRAAALKNSEAYANLALIQRNQALSGGQVHLIKESVNNIHRALAVDSFNIEAYATLALVLYDHAKSKSQLEMARLICVQATKVDDKYAPVYNILGLILLKQEKVTPALREFRKAVAIDNNFLEAHMNIGAITLSFRDYKSAEESFRRVLTLNPSKQVKKEAHVGLGVALRGQRKYREAMAEYKRALALDPTDVGIAYNQGILIQDYMFDASNPARAIQDLQTASNFLQRYINQGRSSAKKQDAQRRVKNINELIPMLREQQKMMKSMGGKT